MSNEQQDDGNTVRPVEREGYTRHVERREIKFRVWTGHEMVQPAEDFILRGDGDLFEMFSDNCELSNAPVMQYTGLKDKNGTEIYEGDILSYLGAGRMRADAVYWSDEHGSWCVGPSFFLGHLCSSERDYLVRRLGNVFENSDLLE